MSQSKGKWHSQPDILLFNLELQHISVITQLFYKKLVGSIRVMNVNISDDTFATGPSTIVKTYILDFTSNSELHTVARILQILRFFVMNIIQGTYYTWSNYADDKLKALTLYPITIFRRRKTVKMLNEINRSAFMSQNSLSDWTGLTTSPFLFHFCQCVTTSIAKRYGIRTGFSEKLLKTLPSRLITHFLSKNSG